ncbi:DAZ-associated protein 1 [Desmophyllum pertusum]|uniref:DAZ-associated protein 1 n=1 Tax=Desmophyllum pertusum TaxID=174260 RepID=A0A9W9ZEB5_9CNID|nr:DAZ-associated protein 1 [Desmophyllum pertusum]
MDSILKFYADRICEVCAYSICEVCVGGICKANGICKVCTDGICEVCADGICKVCANGISEVCMGSICKVSTGSICEVCVDGICEVYVDEVYATASSTKSAWKTSAKSAPIAPMPSVKSAQIVSSWTASPRAEFARTGGPEVQKRKILVTRQRGWGGEITLNSVYDYFSAFGKIELVREAEDLVYITFESADSVERVMLVMNHKINDVMVLVSLAYTDKQKKQLRMEKAMDEANVNQNPRNIKIAEKEGRKIVFMTPTRFKDSISEESLETYFSSYGAIEEIFIMESKGYGFITFKESHAAQQVLEDGDHKIDDKDIYVKMSLATRRKPQNSQDEEKRICVSNISSETSEKDIWMHFSKFGKVAKVVFANKPDSGERTDSGVVVFDSINGGISSLVNELHEISTQQDALVVKLGEDQVTTLPYTAKLHVNNIPDEMTLEMLQAYFGGFGSIQYLGFTSYHSEGEASTMRGVSLVFNNESALEKALNKPVHEINGLEVNVKKATRSFAGRPSDFLSLRVLMTNLPANLDELAVKDYLSGQACRVKSVRFLSPTVCIASLWNLSDVDRLVNMAI